MATSVRHACLRPLPGSGDLAGEGIEAAGIPADLADRDALPGVIEVITGRFGPIDVLEYAPSGLDWLTRRVPIRDADAASFVTGSWDPGTLPQPLDPANLADAMWDLYVKRDRFEQVVAPE